MGKNKTIAGENVNNELVVITNRHLADRQTCIVAWGEVDRGTSSCGVSGHRIANVIHDVVGI